jgi:hypothetical protein
MTFDEFRHRFQSYRDAVNKESLEARDQSILADGLTSLYDSFSQTEREMGNRVISEWIVSSDESLRFSAQLLVQERRISAVMPALEQLQDRLAIGTAPGDPYELSKVHRILMELRRLIEIK